MFWSLSMQLMPGESIIEDSTEQKTEGIRPTYSVFLTTKRVVFRFDGFGSSMSQFFSYDEIVGAAPAKRLLITYLNLRTSTKSYFLHIPTPDHWSEKILKTRDRVLGSSAAHVEKPAEQKKQGEKEELLDMLRKLRQSGVLTDEEFREKSKALDAMNR
ncbi:MAG: hypothetical protein M0042_16475 [Nitrospiraceae bacterium]|nr:hypothetical protein [Nitrospiraceae bacterium]